MNLDPSQLAAATSEAKRLVIVAGAGSGKTRVFTQRIFHAIDSGYSPGRILALTFTRMAAQEIRKRIEAERPGARGLTVGTFHGVFFKILNEYAPRLGYQRPITPYDEYFSTDILVDEMISMGLPYSDRAKNESLRRREPQAIYDLVRRFKEKDPKNWSRLMGAYHRKLKAHNAVGYEEMISLAIKLLTTWKDVREELHNLWSWVLIDEAQDTDEEQMEVIRLLNPEFLTLIGDDGQCVDEDTKISTPFGIKKISEIEKGDTVLSVRQGSTMKQLVNRIDRDSKWDNGIKITTSGNHTLLMSPNHKIWASSPKLSNNQHIVYLMFRKDLGFRVGKTNKCINENGVCNYGSRTMSEAADKLWILRVEENNEAALYWEEIYSLKYGIPTCVFNGRKRGLNQDRINSIFNIFGQNGLRLLGDINQHFDYPHWMSQGNPRRGKMRINLMAHSAANNQVSMEWQGNQLDNLLKGHDVHIELNNRRRIRKYFASYIRARIYAEQLALLTDNYIRERIMTDKGILPLVTAGSLFEGMNVIVLGEENEIGLEKIISIERDVPGKFYDIQIDDSANFFGNNILSHNSIYAWRGANPENMIRVAKESTVINLETNYRSGKTIVEASNRLLSHNENQLPRTIGPAWYADDGLCCYRMVASANSQLEVAAKIAELVFTKRRSPSDIAVLCRTNRVAKQVSQYMREYEVPHVLITKGEFWSTESVRSIVANLILLQNRKNNMAFYRAVNFPRSVLTPEIRAKIKGRAAKDRCYIFDAAMRMSIEPENDQERRIRDWCLAFELIASEYRTSQKGTVLNARECLDRLSDQLGWLDYFRALSPSMTRPQVVLDRIRIQMDLLREEERPGLAEFLEWYAGRDLQDEAKQDEQFVTVCTMHAAKGLEWPVVFTPAWNLGEFPSESRKRPVNVEEERRLAYVTITRSQEECHIYSDMEPNRFIGESGIKINGELEL